MSSDQPAKYLNSNDTELFHKGNVLYNLARARKAAGRDGKIIVVEGYMDVIALAQVGLDTAVAPLGTALTENQLELLWRMTGEPVLCFDGDQAGLRAAWRAADLALPMIAAGRTLRFAILPEGQDPDDLVRAKGAGAMRDVLDQARPLADLLWMRETASGVFDTPERRAELEQNLRSLAGRIRDESVRRHYGQEFRERVQAYFGNAGFGPGRGGRREAAGGSGRAQAKGRLAVSENLARSALVRGQGGVMPLREAGLMTALVNHPFLLEEHFEEVERLVLASPELRRLLAVLVDAVAHDMAHDRDTLLELIRRSELEAVWERANSLARRARLWPALEGAAAEDVRDAFRQALHLQRAAHFLNKELRAAESALASEPTEENYRHLVEIQTQLRSVQATEALIEGFGVGSGRAVRG